ncbi:hypothetical protein EUGRSUZ_K03135 [Eucalyptus grandis]|uniref:Uncharacterized protein n=2 Tax=Eucalyptus grandis TaxID=71139 RepID=A0ACC3IZ41_EUCGR|nr:hypothetical protein EUGRSUZ_K03135 [Eucalyptus grandis]
MSSTSIPATSREEEVKSWPLADCKMFGFLRFLVSRFGSGESLPFCCFCSIAPSRSAPRPRSPGGVRFEFCGRKP